MHPRLLSTLVLIEPVIIEEHDGGPGPAIMATMRRDIWDTRAKAEASLGKAFSTWESRAIKKFLEYGLRQVPTAIYNTKKEAAPSNSVTLTTSKHQEAWAYSQINFEPQEAGLDRLILPDWHSDIGLPYIAFRPESFMAMQNLPYLRPSVFYIFGASSPLSSPRLQDQKVKRTGTGIGGSGGLAEKMVEKQVLEKTGHLVIFEQPGATANATADWIEKWLNRWLNDQQCLFGYKSKKSDADMLKVSKAWVDAVKLPSNAPRPTKPKL